MNIPWLSLAAVVVLVAVHLLAGRLRALEHSARRMWLSAFGGVSVAYVFVHLFPDLAEGQRAIADAVGGILHLAERHVYLLALAGLVIFYGLERAAHVSRRRRAASGEEDSPSSRVFWLHVAAFAAYNGLIGYLLNVREATGEGDVVLSFAFAVGLHFVVNDFRLREHHDEDYERIGRWILAGAIAVGWLLGFVVVIPEAARAALLALLAGGIVLNALKEELPEERESRFWPFALGAAAYALILLAL